MINKILKEKFYAVEEFKKIEQLFIRILSVDKEISDYGKADTIHVKNYNFKNIIIFCSLEVLGSVLRL